MIPFEHLIKTAEKYLKLKMRPLNLDDLSAYELAKGKKVEKEHTDNPRIAKQIAVDHLNEDAKYYTHLDKVEKKAFLKNPQDLLDASLLPRTVSNVLAGTGIGGLAGAGLGGGLGFLSGYKRDEDGNEHKLRNTLLGILGGGAVGAGIGGLGTAAYNINEHPAVLKHYEVWKKQQGK